MSIQLEKPDKELAAGNYCVSFIDLLGQRAVLKGQGLLPPFGSEDERKKLDSILKNSIGSIIKLQRQAERMLRDVMNPNPEHPFLAGLTPEQHTLWDELQCIRVTTQRWSDGLVSFVCLGDQEIKCYMNSLFALFGMAGTLCFLGLATRRPVRGAIEFAWGVEVHPGELYGAAVARAYELESEVAQYPRIVVGPATVKLLEHHRANLKQDPYSQLNREMAIKCLDMLLQDTDGHWILHYLGERFQHAISQIHHATLYADAGKFIVEQLIEHKANFNTKLAFRYSHLLQYFEAHPPA